MAARLCNNTTRLLLPFLLVAGRRRPPHLRQRLLDGLEEPRDLCLGADRDPEAPKAAVLPAPEPDHDALCLGQALVDGQRRLVVRLAVCVQHLVQQEVALGAAAQPPDAGDPGQPGDHPVPLGDEPRPVLTHGAETLGGQGVRGQGAGGGGDVIGGLEAVQDAGDWGRAEGGAEPDAGHAEGLGQGLHDDEVGPLVDPLGQGGLALVAAGEVDVGLVQHDDAIPGGMLEDAADVILGQQRAGGVSRGAQVDELDVVVGGVVEGGEDGGQVELEGRGGEQGHAVQGDVVDVGGDGVHAVGGGADQDAVTGGDTEAAQEGIDGLVGADADKEVVRGEGLVRVGTGAAQVAQLLLEGVLVRVRVAVQA